ncbi:type 1 glutamine amidotransferase [Gellertiella hungarica]|uniref:GMP synthase (Glutamine-hydrolyzing) n=1 Tax=Gellertiella hungarica TaxID=1572859 RepID=A0A7W6NLD2_9HYPH|nr:type 1 glutamine amidotransferase [Gellertiella hungarica]MBB4066425.1 GMP synthase (glutamine-hydrolyzing) [Gellertiella hungarica]
MRVAVVENTVISHLGQVGVALEEAGAEIVLYRPFRGEVLPDVTRYDGLVVLGGEQSAIDDDLHPYLPHLAARMRQAAEAGKAVLGICLGSQILARAFGGRNILGQTREFGWHRIYRTDEGRNDPVLSAVEEGFPIFQWHSDTFTLPEGAVHLARNEAVTNQAFRIGRAAYGTQFHFEASRPVVEEWNSNFGHLIEAMAPGWIDCHPALAEKDGAEADKAGLAIARAWVKQIRT